MRDFYGSYLSLGQIPVPIIAAVNGAAVGAGMCLAAAADLRVVAKSAKIGVNFTHLGISPGMGATFNLPPLMGNQWATYMMLSGELISGAEAAARGFAITVADDADKTLLEAIRIANILAANSPIAVRQTIRSLRTQFEAGLEAALVREADAQAHCLGHADFTEGLSAVEAKRTPKF